MNKTIYNRIRDFVRPTLETNSATGSLSEDERACAIALFETLTASPAVSCLEHVESRTSSQAGYLKAYRDGLAMLGGNFVNQTSAQRDATLRKVLRRYPYRSNEPGWKQRLRVTGGHLDQIFASAAKKRFRQFVVRDLMEFYFQGSEGWAIVGYGEFPGHVRYDDEECEIVKLIDDIDGRVLLELSDATIEELDPSGLLADKDFVLTAAVKCGRKRAGFSRSAYYQIAERVDMDGERFVLRLGSETFEIPCI